MGDWHMPFLSLCYVSTVRALLRGMRNVRIHVRMPTEMCCDSDGAESSKRDSHAGCEGNGAKDAGCRSAGLGGLDRSATQRFDGGIPAGERRQSGAPETGAG